MFASPQPSFACAVNPEALRGLWPTNISLREHFYVYNNQMAVLDGSLSQAIDHHFAAAWLDAASGSSNCEAAGQAAFARAVWRRFRAAPLGDPIKLLRFVVGELPRGFDEF
jgi:hypothetical protein